MFAFTPFDLFFFVVAIATIASALWILISRNIIHAAIGLLFTLFGVGGMYLMLASDFLGFLQLFIYIGATMVLIMFGIMLTRREERGCDDKVTLSQRLSSRVSTIVGLSIAGAVFAFLFVILIVAGGEQWEKQPAVSVEPPTGLLGEKLLTEYVYAFEIISVFLMVALIGAAYLARRREVPVRKTQETEVEQIADANSPSEQIDPEEINNMPDEPDKPDVDDEEKFSDEENEKVEEDEISNDKDDAEEEK
ncbi:MAG: NADH-quinone oxidoreductase subunit J [Planctomycetes bacterium]|nr:NADH-quinone oxidoreductase subunit J [Planctomycetota bacterium]